MDWTVCSRETERDYTWDTTHAGPVSAKNAQRFFAPAFEGSITRSRFAALLRSPNSPQGVILCVSVSTNRRDFSRTPIRTLTVLRAETPEETGLLAAFFAECLRKPDKETLYNPESKITQAVESLYQTKKPDDFLRFCRSLPTANGSGAKPTGRRAIPRGDTASRQEMVESLPALIGDGKPFLIALTDRTPSDVIASLGTMVDRGVVRIFSKATSTVEKLPEPAPQKYVRAAAIGGAVLLAILVAAIGPCSKPDREGPAPRDTNIVSRAIDGGEASTNSVRSGGPSGKSAGETRQGDSTTNAVTENAETAEAVTNQNLHLNQ